MRILPNRLDRQLISRPRFTTPAEVVAWFGAMQAQDYLAAQWALGLRTPKATRDTIESALADGSVIRTHLFRGTWQYVAPKDVRWMLGLVGARVIASGASRYREVGLDDRTLQRCCELFARALAGGRQLTRREMGAVLTRARVPDIARRLSHILSHAELHGVISSGRRRGKQQTYALLDDRAPKVPPLTRDEALSTLTRRYFQSRGPATVGDFAWWSGLTMGDAREAIETSKAWLVTEQIAGEKFWVGSEDRAVAARRSTSAHLLPAFDEYLVGYRDRGALIDPAHVRQINAGGGMLRPAVVIDGRVIGTWKRTLRESTVAITVRPFRRLTGREGNAIRRAAHRYAKFVGLTARISGVGSAASRR